VTGERPSVVDPGSFLALVLRSLGKGAGGVDDLWASNQAATFILAGGAPWRGSGHALAQQEEALVPAVPHVCQQKGWCPRAGYETTANALGFAIYLLASHPGDQGMTGWLPRRVFLWCSVLLLSWGPSVCACTGCAEAEARMLAELDAYGRQRVPTLAELEGGELGYTQAVMQEALRMFPPGGTLAREANAGMVLGGLAVPLGTAVQVSIWSMHRNPRYWREPLAFKPERFLPGTPEAAEVVPGAFLPFGDGSRKCIGYKWVGCSQAQGLW
jgi:hypothetical protein